MHITAYTNKGPDKSENEDRIIIGKTILTNGLLSCEYIGGVIAVADGVGGNKGGAYASHFVAERICREKNITGTLLGSINSMLLEKSKADDNLTGMATTLTGITIEDGKYNLFHVGNTRLYEISQRGYLRQITTDDTTLQFLLSTRQLSEEEAEGFTKKNEITACMGGEKPELFKPKFSEHEMQGLAYILTCDGIHDYLSLDQIEETVVSCKGHYDEALTGLVEKARECGSTDDASVIVLVR